jgi:hypothetical protein
LSSDNRFSSEATRRKLEGSSNPLSNYLQQWLSPQDRRLLGEEKLNQTSLERAGIHEEEPFRPKVNYDTKPLLSNPREHLAIPGDRMNPYLTPGPTDENFLTEPLAPLPNSFTARPPLSPLSNSAGDQRTYSPNGDMTPAQNGSAKLEALPPPTAPLLDERRYFPQLRRF